MVLRLPQDFSADLLAGRVAQAQLLLDARRSNSALMAQGYAAAIVGSFAQDLHPGRTPPLVLLTRDWFNPTLESTWFILPGLVCILSLIMSLLISALSLARERELGTFEQLLVTPLRPAEILVGKALPGIIVGLINANIVIAAALLWFRLPFRGNLALLEAMLLLYTLAGVGIGLVLSSFARTQQQAMLGVFVFASPMIVLSGYAAPVENMPPLAELASRVDPVRYMLVIARGLFLQDMPLAVVLRAGLADGADRGGDADRGGLRGTPRGKLGSPLRPRRQKMNDAPTISEAPSLDGKAIAELAEQLNQLLHLRTFPIGMKLFEDLDAMANVPGLRRPPRGKTFSTCQLVTQARMAGFTLGITTENIPSFSSCSSVIGLDAPGEIYTSGRKMEGVWFENREAAAAHQAGMPRVPPGRYHGMVVSPLRTARLDPPDICLFYGNPAQMILFINGLQWRSYRRYDFSITGESACADSWGHALKTREVSAVDPVLCGAPLRRCGRRGDADGLPARRPRSAR